MSSHSRCPNCSCTDEGTVIYKCTGCGTIFCRECADGAVGPWKNRSPDCGEMGMAIGEIKDSDD